MCFGVSFELVLDFGGGRFSVYLGLVEGLLERGTRKVGDQEGETKFPCVKVGCV